MGGGGDFPLLGLKPLGEALLSAMSGQCDIRRTVTFQAERHHHPLAGTKLYCSMTEAHVC